MTYAVEKDSNRAPFNLLCVSPSSVPLIKKCAVDMSATTPFVEGTTTIVKAIEQQFTSIERLAFAWLDLP